MKKKLLYGLLIVILAATSLFAACKTATTQATSQPAPTQATSTAPPPPTSAAPTQANWWDKFGTPQYGNTIIVQVPTNGDTLFDPGVWGGQGRGYFDDLFNRDWAVDRKTESFRTEFVPVSCYKSGLAESWEQADPSTYTVHIHQGVKWGNKAPMNGRELTADDVVYTYDRILGTGSGFTKPTMPFAMVISNVDRVIRVDKYTVQFKMKKSSFWGVYDVFSGGFFAIDIVAPELVQQDLMKDWKNAVGYGPWVLTDFSPGTSCTYAKNPDYWGYDERYPKNKLPYADGYKELVIPDVATAQAALRTGKVDIMEQMNASTWQQAAAIAKSNPDILQSTWPSPGQHLQMRVDKTPFTDIKVRMALQMAVDLKTIAANHYGGNVPGVGCGLVYPGFAGYTLPFDKWDANLQQEYTFNPTKAKQLLTEAGYPNGFKTNICAAATGEDIELLQVIKSEFMDIGVDMEIKMFADLPAKQAFTNAMKQDQMTYANSVGVAQSPNMSITRIMPGSQGNCTANDDPAYVDLIKQAQSAQTEADAKRLCTEVDMYGLKQHWCVNVTPTVSPIFWQPWLKGNSGEFLIGGLLRFYVTRWWIDSSVKK